MHVMYIMLTQRRPFVQTCLDFHTMQLGGKLVIDCKNVTIFYLLGLGFLCKNSLSGLPTGQRLQCSHQLPLWDVCLLLDLLHSEKDPTSQ